jgi:protein-disulfide isomerase
LKTLAAIFFCLCFAGLAHAQNTPAGIAGNDGAPFQNVSALKLPAGAKAAVFEFEDMECPACARTFPIVHAAVAHYKIPLVRHDFPWSFHEWSLNAAITARFLQDQFSPQLADTFRHDIFANQNRIESKDELARFTRDWFATHHENLPFVLDASGKCRNEVETDKALGDHLNIRATPCVIVVTRTSWVSVPYANITDLDRTIGQAIAEARQPAILPRTRSQRLHP